MIILKPVLEPTNSDAQSQLRKYFTKDLFFGRSSRSMQLFTRFISSFLRLLYCHLCSEIQKLLYNLPMLLLLSGYISLNPGPTPNSLFQSFWKPFENKCLHFLDINSILPKLDAIIGITKSKVDNSLSDSEVKIPGYCIL